MRALIFLGFILTISALPFAPAGASALEKWGLNGQSDEPPIPADRGVILGTVGDSVKTLGLFSQPLHLQFKIKESAPG